MVRKWRLVVLICIVLAIGLCGCGSDKANVKTPENYEATLELMESAIAEITAPEADRTAAEELELAERLGNIGDILSEMGDYTPNEGDEKPSAKCKKCYFYQAIAYENAADKCDDNESKRNNYQKAIDIAGSLGSYGVGKKKSEKASTVFKESCQKQAECFLSVNLYLEAASMFKTAGNTEEANRCVYMVAMDYYNRGAEHPEFYNQAYYVLEEIRSATVINPETNEQVVVSDFLNTDEHMIRAREEKYNEGNYIYFGTFEQDGNLSNGAEQIQWRILRREGNDLLLLCVNALDCKQYNKTWTNVNWETSSMKTYLNQDVYFLSSFTNEEKAMMMSGEGLLGIGAEEKVFILSEEEAKENCSSEDLYCYPTTYAAANGVWQSSDHYCWWWLRDFEGDCAKLMRHDGKVEDSLFYVSYGHAGFRPAIRIRISD